MTRTRTTKHLKMVTPNSRTEIKIVKRCWRDMALSWAACLVIVGALFMILWPI